LEDAAGGGTAGVGSALNAERASGLSEPLALTEAAAWQQTEADRARYYLAKRLTDVLVAAFALVLVAPFLALVAIAIKVDSAGPVLFRQRRVGSRRRRVNGQVLWEPREFTFYKFRSMVRDADSSLHEEHVRAFVTGAIEAAGGHSQFKLANDPRITRVGYWLRQLSIDELPELLNVVRGDMSLVGPRPLPTYEVMHHDASHCARLAAPSGITGLWQIKGRADIPFDAMIDLDLEYVRNQSVWLDLKIVALTVPAVLSRRGAG
jgi:lipopolysaccharide/colanic/teichoic acid biosynthesis glycosyltransferase